MRKVAFLCLIIMIMSGCTSTENTTKSISFYTFEEYIEFVSSSIVEKRIKVICGQFSEDVVHDYIELLQKMPVLIPCYNEERLFLQANDLILKVPYMGGSEPVSDSQRNDCLHYLSFHQIGEGKACTFRFSYIIPPHKEAARQAADIYEYRNATKASSVLNGTEELVATINGEEIKCAYEVLSNKGMKHYAQFLWKDMYVVGVVAASKEKLMEVLNGLSFEEVSVSVKGE